MSKLSLCVIVGKEAEELENLLKSTQGPLFDEIVVTTTQDSEAVEEVARKYASAVHCFPWVDDFSAARNFCYSKASGTHIMWMDADDELSTSSYAKLESLKPELDNWDVVLLNYNYSFDADNKPHLTLPRERITRNTPEFVWVDPIHEYIQTYAHHKKLVRTDISVDHRRKGVYSPERNLRILKKVYDSGESSPRSKFYYGKDLFEGGRRDEGAEVLAEYLKGPTDFDQNKVLACLRLSEYYESKGDELAHISFLRKALTYHKGYAEVYYALGVYYEKKGDTQEASDLYKEAASKSPDGLFGARPLFYGRYPLDRLAVLHYKEGNYKESLKYVEAYLKIVPDSEMYLRNKSILLSHLKNESPNQEPKEDFQVTWLIRDFNPDDPSQRLRRLNVHKRLVETGNKSNLVTSYHRTDQEWLIKALSKQDVVVFSAFGDYELNLASALQKEGIAVIADLNEDILGMGLVSQFLAKADLVVACSRKLIEKARPHAKRLVLIEDAFEEVTEEVDYFKNREKPVALYMGMGGNSFLVTDYLRKVVEDSGYELRVCTEWDNADTKWELDKWQGVMADADVVLCPQRVEVQPAKSNIKAAQAMAFGLPVVASPLPAYTEFVQNGRNGYICSTQEQWGEALRELRNLPKRIQIGMNAKTDVEPLFGIDTISGKWRDALARVSGGALGMPHEVPKTQVASKETVAIIIPVYNGVEYLKACVAAIHLNTLYPYHLVLSDAGSDEETWEYLRTLRGVTVLGDPKVRKNFSEAVNDGVSASGRGRFFAVLNSDVIVSKGWLTNIVSKMEKTDRLGACGVLSNCDSGWLFNNPRNPESPVRNMRMSNGAELRPGMKYGEVIPMLDDLQAFMNDSNTENSGAFVEQSWVAYYATVFARSAWDAVGYLDPMYKNGCEDLDHARRMTNLGFKIGQSLDAFVFHFGGVSRGAYQSENKDEYDKEDQYNHYAYAKKWEKKEIVIYTGPAWEKWGREDVDKGMAGSETWAAELGAEFSKAGHRVTIFGDPTVEGTDRDGVQYLHHSKMKDYLEYRYISLCILSRTCEPPKRIMMHTNQLYVMVHDVWLSQDKNYDTLKWAVKGFGVLSHWHDEFFRNHHSIEPDKTFLTFNGVRQELYEGVDVSKKKNKMVYSSSPDRGLEVLLDLIPRIREEVPDFEVDVAYGFHNWESMAKQLGDQVSLQRIQVLKSKMDQPGVNYLGRVSKKELAERQKESKIWAYPTGFSETFCVTGLENSLALNAAITTPYAGLLTTLGDAAIYVRGPHGAPIHQWPLIKEYQDKFVHEVVRTLKDEEYRRSIAEALKDKVSKYTWGRAAEQWLKLAGL